MFLNDFYWNITRASSSFRHIKKAGVTRLFFVNTIFFVVFAMSIINEINHLQVECK
jgi:hypothetical protein